MGEEKERRAFEPLLCPYFLLPPDNEIVATPFIRPFWVLDDVIHVNPSAPGQVPMECSDHEFFSQPPVGGPQALHRLWQAAGMTEWPTRLGQAGWARSL